MNAHENIISVADRIYQSLNQYRQRCPENLRSQILKPSVQHHVKQVLRLVGADGVQVERTTIRKGQVSLTELPGGFKEFEDGSGRTGVVVRVSSECPLDVAIDMLNRHSSAPCGLRDRHSCWDRVLVAHTTEESSMGLDWLDSAEEEHDLLTRTSTPLHFKDGEAGIVAPWGVGVHFQHVMITRDSGSQGYAELNANRPENNPMISALALKIKSIGDKGSWKNVDVMTEFWMFVLRLSAVLTHRRLILSTFHNTKECLEALQAHS